MKIFWSWQSDTPGKIGRHFIRDALKIAIENIKQDLDLDEPIRNELHLDHDRQGVPGSPDLARVILDKIVDSLVVVADVTNVGQTINKKGLINSNVAIELGYALATLKDTGLLMVMNEHYGAREDLPFDLRHKAGPIVFNLPDDATKSTIRDEKKKLSRDLTKALRDSVDAQVEIRAPNNSKQPETPIKSSCAQYFSDNETIVKRDMSNASTDELKYRTQKLLYLRVIPTKEMSVLRESDMAEMVYGIKVQPLNSFLRFGSSHGRNLYGGITYSYTVEDSTPILLSSTQIFRNHELWGIDADTLDDEKFLDITRIESLLQNALQQYLSFGKKYLGYKAPLIIEAGASSVEGIYIAMAGSVMGPIVNSEIRSRHNLPSLDDGEVNKALLMIFEDFFDASGSRRPENFRRFPEVAT